MTNVTHNFFYVFIYIFNSLHVSSTSCSSSGETNCANTTCGSCHSVSVAGSCTRRKTCTRHGHRQLPEDVLTQFVSPDDEHDVLETCRELKIKINTWKGICSSRWSFTKNHYMTHSQQNIKDLPKFICYSVDTICCTRKLQIPINWAQLITD
jgi:hypothetical protein